MPDTAKVDRVCIESIVSDLMLMLPLIRKKLLNLDDIKQKNGLPMTHMHLLALLKHEGPTTVSEIARRFMIAKPNITPLIDRLSGDGLVERIRVDADKRVVLIRLTAAGEARLEMIYGVAADHLISHSDRLSQEDFQEMRVLCSKLYDLVGKATV